MSALPNSFDGFDHYSAAQMTTYGDFTSVVTAGGGTATVSAGNGWNGSASFRCVGGGLLGGSYGVKTFAPGDASFVFGFWVKVASISLTTLFVVGDGATAQLSVILNADGTLTVARGATGLATSSFAISAGASFYLELKGTIHPSAGSFELRVNGQTRIGPTTGVNTRNTANTQWNTVFMGVVSGVAIITLDLDNMYVLDGVDATATQGTPNNDFLSEIVIPCIMGTADGANADFARSSGSADRYTYVDENPATDDTDYLTATNVGDRQTLQYVIPAIGDVLALVPVPALRKTDAGTRKIKASARIGGVDYDATLEHALSQSYAHYPTPMMQDPATSAPWTPGTKDIGIVISV